MNLRQLATNWYPKFKLSLAHICSMYIDIYEWSPLSYIYIPRNSLQQKFVPCLEGAESPPSQSHYFQIGGIISLFFHLH
jgi:hypothetical protein